MPVASKATDYFNNIKKKLTENKDHGTSAEGTVVYFYNFFLRTNVIKFDSIPQIPLHSQVENVIDD